MIMSDFFSVSTLVSTTTVLIAVTTVYWGSFRSAARCAEVSKRERDDLEREKMILEFRLSLTMDPVKQERLRRTAAKAVSKIAEVAQRERVRINWPARTRQTIIEQKLMFKLNWSRQFTLTQKLDWTFCKGMAVIVGFNAWLLTVFLVSVVRYSYGPIPFLLLLLCTVMLL